MDKIVVAFAGSHDKANSFIWYDAQGNAKTLTGRTAILEDVTNWTNVLVALPFAVSTLLPPAVWNAVGITVVK